MYRKHSVSRSTDVVMGMRMQLKEKKSNAKFKQRISEAI